MKDQEIKYLNSLFSQSADEQDESAIDLPLLDVPSDLSEKLYAITASVVGTTKTSKQTRVKPWPKFASIAASLLMAVVLVQGYQQKQTLSQLDQARTDLATALHYLGEANQIAHAQMLTTLNKNIRKATFEPVMEIGRDAVLPTVESLKSVAKKSYRTL